MTAATADAPTTPRRYAVYGTGWRASMYIDAMTGAHSAVATPVAWCDSNETRMRHYDGVLAERGIDAPPHYAPDQLAQMLAEQRVDVLVVCSPDHTHADAVSTALAAGVDVVCEKPLTQTAEGLRQIEETLAASDASLTVTFNYRYAPRNAALKQVIADGLIGDVISVHFEWLLDTVHGADYFRRWHRDKANSGGLAVHKATHHLVNWWLDDVPSTVYALGDVRFYGDQGAGRPAGERPALGRDAAAEDPFGFQMSGALKSLYADAETEDGYQRDQDVFAPGVTTEDTLNVLVGYRSGAAMTYALTAHSPWEGYRVSVNGTRGRAELEVVERAHVARDETSALLTWDDRPAVDPSLAPGAQGEVGAREDGTRLVVQRQWGVARELPVEEPTDGHGGGDPLLLTDVFRGVADDPLGRAAGYRDGVRSVAVGLGINRSLETGLPVRLEDDLGLALG